MGLSDNKHDRISTVKKDLGHYNVLETVETDDNRAQHFDPMELYHSIYHDAPIFYSNQGHAPILGLHEKENLNYVLAALPSLCKELLLALLRKNAIDRSSLDDVKKLPGLINIKELLDSGGINRSKDIFFI